MKFTILKEAPFKPCQMRQCAKAPKAVTLVERIADGKSIYAKTCFACHQADW
jgi:mono/diheme cytochrome c family protein